MIASRSGGIPILVALLLAALPVPVLAEGPVEEVTCDLERVGCEEWVTRFNGGSWDQPMDLATGPVGGEIYVTGFSGTDDTGYDVVTMAYSPTDGAESWRSTFSATTGTDLARAVAVSPDGQGVFVTGTTNQLGKSLDFLTVAYHAASGAEAWTAIHDGDGGPDQARDVAVGPDGSLVFVTGEISFGESTNIATVAYDAASGEQVWAEAFDGPAHGEDSARAVAASPDGTTVFVAGTSEGPSSGRDAAILGYDAATGDLLWSSRYKGAGGTTTEVARSLAIAPDGSTLYVLTEAEGDGTDPDTDVVVLALDTITGDGLWNDRYDGPASWFDGAGEIVIHPGGSSVFVAGSAAVTTGEGLAQDFLVISYNAATGTRRWVRLWDGPSNQSDVARAIAVTPDGSELVVTGETQVSVAALGESTLARSDFATIGLDAGSGALKWWARYDYPGIPSYPSPVVGIPSGTWNAEPRLAIVPDGSRAILAGGSLGLDGQYDYATMSYLLGTQGGSAGRRSG
jgi:hypothetical protein